MTATVTFLTRRPLAVSESAALVAFRGQPTVRVRFRTHDGPARWRCDACGRSAEPECRHARAVLAELERQAADDRGPAA